MQPGFGKASAALQLTIGDIVSLLWLGVILVAVNPKRGCRHDREVLGLATEIVPHVVGAYN